MDYGKMVFTVGVVAMGLYGLYLGKYEIATGALGVMAGVLAPHTVVTVAQAGGEGKKEEVHNEETAVSTAAGV